jgi:hypothetical protein
VQTAPDILRFSIKLFGYAAKPMAEALTRKGGALAMPPEGFLVNGTEGPLQEGELERAAEWARRSMAAQSATWLKRKGRAQRHVVLGRNCHLLTLVLWLHS